MSHEIRTPISGIIGLSEHLSDCGLSKDQTEFSNAIQESAKFLLSLINDVLDFSKIESGHLDLERIPFSPYKLINDLSIPLRFQAREKKLELNVICDFQPDAMFVGDPWRLRQILTNLIGNSLKFTEVGHVDLIVHTVEHTSTDDALVQFIVQDSGIGITADAIKSLFEPFQQADSSTARLHGGTGLGLAICRQLAELMGGQILLQSKPGQGTTAICTLPFRRHHGTGTGLITPPMQRRSSTKITTANKTLGLDEARDDLIYQQPSSSELALARTRTRILLVEDNNINRKVIALAIKKLGYTVTTVNNGQEALEYLCRQSEQPRPNVVLMDCMMPVVDGYEATRRIRGDTSLFDENVRALPIIALTASAVKGDREKCWEAGMDDYLTKPAARAVLDRTISKWIRSERPQGSKRGRPADWDDEPH